MLDRVESTFKVYTFLKFSLKLCTRFREHTCNILKTHFELQVQYPYFSLTLDCLHSKFIQIECVLSSNFQYFQNLITFRFCENLEEKFDDPYYWSHWQGICSNQHHCCAFYTLLQVTRFHLYKLTLRLFRHIFIRCLLSCIISKFRILTWQCFKIHLRSKPNWFKLLLNQIQRGKLFSTKLKVRWANVRCLTKANERLILKQQYMFFKTYLSHWKMQKD